MLDEAACRSHMRHQVDVITFVAMVVIYIYDASWMRLLVVSVLRRAIVEQEAGAAAYRELMNASHRRGVMLFAVANAAVAVYSHVHASQWGGALPGTGIFTLVYGTRPASTGSTMFVVAWDAVLLVLLYTRLAMRYGDVLGDGGDAREVPTVFHLDYLQALK